MATRLIFLDHVCCARGVTEKGIPTFLLAWDVQERRMALLANPQSYIRDSSMTCCNDRERVDPRLPRNNLVSLGMHVRTVNRLRWVRRES